MSLKSDINKDLKTSMLDGDSRRVSILKSIKSAILYKEVADSKREEGLDDETVQIVLKKEVKSRQDALEMYKKANEKERADEEEYQISVIKSYLPEELSEEATIELVKKTMQQLQIDNPEPKDMGRIIGAVKDQSSNADGSVVAKVVKDLINS